MQAASLEILEKAALPPAQARAIVQAIEIAGAKDTIATKQDMLLLRHEVKEKLSELRSEIHAAAGTNARQMYAAMLGQLAVLLGVAYFFVNHLPR